MALRVTVMLHRGSSSARV